MKIQNIFRTKNCIELVEQGKLGDKSGQGVYTYGEGNR